MSRARGNEVVSRCIVRAEAKGTLMRTAQSYEGRRIKFDNRTLYNFGSCSYLGLERHPELRAAAVAAMDEYGTQFSISRAYLECGLYQELESNLEKMTGRPVLVAPSTTLAHIAALPVLIQDNDAVLLDHFAHASLHSATELLGDAPVHLVRHSRMDQVDQLVGELSCQYDRIWLIIDGIYSMFGDVAPFNELASLLDSYPRLHIYIDDAHATSWLGTHGRGGALMHFGHHDRVVVALSLNKAFSAAGGALALPNTELKMQIRRCGGPMLFSGPIQPPMLGAAVASSRLHLGVDHVDRQHELLRRIDYTLVAADKACLPLATRCQTPIFFIPCDSVDQVTDTVRGFFNRGFYVCPSIFPAVPLNRPGIRFTITLHNELEDIDAFIATARFMVKERLGKTVGSLGLIPDDSGPRAADSGNY